MWRCDFYFCDFLIKCLELCINVTAESDDFNSFCRQPILFFWKVLDVEAAQAGQIKKWVNEWLQSSTFLAYFLLVLTLRLYPAIIFNWNPRCSPGLFFTDPQIAKICFSNLLSMLKVQLFDLFSASFSSLLSI